jgi:hypothetical protein
MQCVRPDIEYRNSIDVDPIVCLRTSFTIRLHCRKSMPCCLYLILTAFAHIGFQGLLEHFIFVQLPVLPKASCQLEFHLTS